MSTHEPIEDDALARELIERIGPDLLKHDLVSGVAFGTSPEGTSEPGVLLLVRDLGAASAAGLPQSIEGHSVTLVERDFQPLAQAEAMAPDVTLQPTNPLIGGLDIAPADVLNRRGGTLGVCVLNSSGGAVLVSNFHVLYNNGYGHGPLAIDQPSFVVSDDHQHHPCADRISYFIGPWQTLQGVRYGVDAAAAIVGYGRQAAIGQIPPFPKIIRAAWPKTGTYVGKSGAATGVTYGTVRSTTLMTSEVLAGITYNMPNQTWVQGAAGKFASPGDSGSVILDFDPNGSVAVALLWGGDLQSGDAIASPFIPAMQSLGWPINAPELFGA